MISSTNLGQKEKTFQGQRFDEDLGLNWHAFKWRNYDASLARFHNIDPLAEEYSYQSPYNFSENRVIDGVELEGLEWENFMTSFKKPGQLNVKSPNVKTSQRQHYSVTAYNPNKSFSEIKSAFKAAPHSLLTNTNATFNAPVDGDGNPSEFKVGSNIKIDILGPSNNSYVRVKDIEESENKISSTFVTLDGHVEKGVITFSFTQDKNGNVVFDINSLSEPDWGSAPDKLSRKGQKESWFEVLNNIANYLGDKGTNGVFGQNTRTRSSTTENPDGKKTRTYSSTEAN